MSTEERARKLAIERVENSGPPSELGYKVERFFARSGRLILGMVFILGALWACDSAPSISDRSLGSLTLREICGFIIACFVVYLLVTWAFSIAFGAAPPKPSAEAQTAGRIEAQMHWAREEIRRQDEEVRCKAQRQAAHNFGKKLAVMLTRRLW